MVSGRASVTPACHHGPFQLRRYLGRDRTGWPEAGAPQGDAPPPKSILRPMGAVVMGGQGWMKDAGPRGQGRDRAIPCSRSQGEAEVL